MTKYEAKQPQEQTRTGHNIKMPNNDDTKMLNNRNRTQHRLCCHFVFLSVWGLVPGGSGAFYMSSCPKCHLLMLVFCFS